MLYAECSWQQTYPKTKSFRNRFCRLKRDGTKKEMSCSLSTSSRTARTSLRRHNFLRTPCYLKKRSYSRRGQEERTLKQGKASVAHSGRVPKDKLLKPCATKAAKKRTEKSNPYLPQLSCQLVHSFARERFSRMRKGARYLYHARPCVALVKVHPKSWTPNDYQHEQPAKAKPLPVFIESDSGDDQVTQKWLGR